MSLDKLILAATEYFITGADVHRRALAGGGGKITDLSEKRVAENDPPVGTTSKTAAKKAEKVTDVVDKPTAVVEQAASKEDTAKREAQDNAAAEAKAAAETPALTDEDLDGTDTNLDYETDIRPVLRAKTLSNRAGLVALLGTFDVKSGAELKAEQYAAFFEKLVAL